MIELISPCIKLLINPEVGGNVTSIVSLSNHDEWIFFDETRRPPGSTLENYDDVWCGGFEELFPNDAAGILKERTFKDHGELWQHSWELLSHDSLNVVMRFECTTVPVLLTKKISLDPEKPQCFVHYSLKNTSNQSFPYLFKLHPAMRIEPGDEILLPNGTVLPVDTTFSKIIGTNGPFSWPEVVDGNAASKDISVIPDESEKLQEFIYVKDMLEGWCGLKRKSTGEKFVLRYSLPDFPYCWLFMALGGWRNYYTIVMEPCTNFPKDMGTAITNGTCAIMKPHETREYSVSVCIEK